MLEHKKIHSLNDFFSELGERRSREVYFYRINGYSGDIGSFIKKYYDMARRTGVVIEGKIPNPDEKNLAYYGEMMGMDFQMNQAFLTAGLKKWLPRMNDSQRKSVADSMYTLLSSMKAEGKTDNMLKNAYIKFMCWFYYKFERVTNRLGDNDIPKILYEGTVSHYELMILSILSGAGCDVVILQYHGDGGYLKVDPQSLFSDNLVLGDMKAFPEGYSLKKLRQDIQKEADRERLYGTRPFIHRYTNGWIRGRGLEDIRESLNLRGDDPNVFYNCFCRINGAEDKLTYANDLFQFQQEMKNNKRKIVIVSGEIPKPSPEEISRIKRGNYIKQDQMLLGLSGNIKYTANIQLERVMREAFIDVMLEESEEDGEKLTRLTNKGVYLLCWLNRYVPLLFANWKIPEIGCFVYLGGCKNESEAMILRFFSRLPLDVLVLCPNLNTRCCLRDSTLYEVNYTESLELAKFPEEGSQVRMGTVAYHAERELDTLMYQDTGLYRNQQYGKAQVINLQTMYEEIKILWDQELKYRPNFSTADGVVNIPVIFAKVSGIKDGLLPQYWSTIKALITEETLVIKKAPYIESSAPNPLKTFAPEFYKNGRLQKAKIKGHPQYKYGILREDIQDFMLEKLETLIDQRPVKGMGENGTEYTAVAQALNLPTEIVRMIQKFDFTKRNPKMIYINTTETVISLEDSLVTAFLNLIGFDILFFVPTGYQSVEKFFSRHLMEEHQIGEYKYDLQVPDLDRIPQSHSSRRTWRNKFFKRGN